jgi:hypothetical protein
MTNKKLIFNLLSIDNNQSLIGSSTNEALKYKTDYDLQEKISNLTPRQALLKFQHIFKVVNKSNDIYISDLKSGLYNTIPIRWNYESIMKGYQMIDTKTIQFIDTLNDQLGNVIKLDLLVYYTNEFHEFSCNYYVNTPTILEHEIYKSLLIDVKKYHANKKYMKMLKRIYSYNLIKNDRKHIKELEIFFNSNAGLLYQFQHKVNTLIDVIDLLPLVNIIQVDKALIKLQHDIPNKYKSLVNKQSLNMLTDMLQNDINSEVIDFLSK